MAFTVKEEVESQDEGFDSEDSDDMGAGDDLDYFSDSGEMTFRVRVFVPLVAQVGDGRPRPRKIY